MDKTSRLNWNFLKPGNWIFWVLLSLILKSGLFLYKINEHTAFPNGNYLNTFGRENGDSRSYIDPVENLVTHGVYNSDISYTYIGSVISYGDYRMPGYGAVYFLLRQIFDTTQALNALVVLQLIVASVSVYVLSLIAVELFNSWKYFYLTFFLYVTSTFVSLYDHIIASESFSVSGLIFSLYFLIKFGNKLSGLLICGLFITWCIFLRPVFAPVLILFSLFILLRNQWPRLQFSKVAVKQVIIFLVPFLLIDGAWIYRNSKLHHQIYPLTTSLMYPGMEGSIVGSVYHFLQSYGGSIVSWKGQSEINYFIPGSELNDYHFPGFIFNDKFNPDSLALVKHLIVQVEDPSTPADVRNNMIEATKEKLERYAQSIREQHPIRNYLTSRVVYLKTFLLHSGTGNLFEKPGNELNVLSLLIKLYSSAIYVFVIIFGFMGCIDFLITQRRQASFVLITLLGLFLMLVHPILLKFDEWRYIVPAYPIFLIAGISMGMKIYHLFVNRKIKHV